MFPRLFDEYSNDIFFYLGGLNDELLEDNYKNIEEEDNKYYDELLEDNYKNIEEEDNKYYDELLYEYDNNYYYDDYDDY